MKKPPPVNHTEQQAYSCVQYSVHYAATKQSVILPEKIVTLQERKSAKDGTVCQRLAVLEKQALQIVK